MLSLHPSFAAAMTAAALLPAALHHVVDAGAPGAVALAGGDTAAAGVADVRTGRPLRATDRVRIGSVTKSFTAVVALQLVGEGGLRLDDTVGRRLPGASPPPTASRSASCSTTPRASPTTSPRPLAEVFLGDPRRIWAPAETLALVRDEPLRFPPGTGWAYSNTDYVLAGLMIERATGRTLGHEIERRIVRPLRLRDTSFPVRTSSLGHARGAWLLARSRPERPDPGTFRDITDYSPSFAWAAGNGVSTVRDVARFYRALLRGRLLPPRLLKQALSGVETGRPGRRFGLGLELRDTPYGTLVGHEGDVPGFSIKALLEPGRAAPGGRRGEHEVRPAGRRRRVRRRR